MARQCPQGLRTRIILVGNAGEDIDFAIAKLSHGCEIAYCESLEAGRVFVVGSDCPPQQALEILRGLGHQMQFDWCVEDGAAPLRKKLLLADMDSTIIACECLDELADFAGVGAQVSAITRRAMAGELNFEAALTERVALIAGLPVAVLEECYRERVQANPGAKRLVQAMGQFGAYTALISGGFTFFADRVAADLGFHEARANVLEHDGEKLTGKVRAPILGRAAKGAYARELIDRLGLTRDEVLVLGDGANDLDMMAEAGLAVGVWPKPAVAAACNGLIRTTTLCAAMAFQGEPFAPALVLQS